MSKTTILLFQQDLRIEDNPALSAATERGNAVLPLFIWSPEEEGNWPLGGASKWWLHHSLNSLRDDLKRIGLDLFFRKGEFFSVLKKSIKLTGADAIFFNRRYEPDAIKKERQLRRHFENEGLHVESFNASLLFEPWTIANKKGKPFQVYTAFWKNCCSLPPPKAPLAFPKTVQAYKGSFPSETLEELQLLPQIPWDEGIRQFWKPGASMAKKRLHHFLAQPILEYKQSRDYPGLEGTSQLSPYLHFGEISSRMIWHETLKRYKGTEEGVNCFLKQLIWREFAYHLLYHFPKTPETPLRENFYRFPWKINQKALEAWQKGLTGYPLVDAGMRQLWKIGWMHNRIRMVVGSFLVKGLLISWVEGAKWFWDTLVDADLANNTLGWQWVAGCGADAVPYFRIFNPVTQGKSFDPKGAYVRKWLPELAKLPNEWIHSPWLAPEKVLIEAGIVMGKTYPFPIVDHKQARKEALEAFEIVKEEDK